MMPRQAAKKISDSVEKEKKKKAKKRREKT